MFPKQSTRFTVNPIQIPMAFFTELEQIILEYVCNHNRPKISKAILRKKNKIGDIKQPDIKLYYKAIIVPKQHSIGTNPGT